MPRRLRVHLTGGFYHVTLRGNHQRDIFSSEADRSLLNVIVARAIETFGAKIHAYCWMKNHLHFLIQVGDQPLGRAMRQIAAEHARTMQLKLATTGHFFERRYHAILVEADTYLLELIRYIHLNPVRAAMVPGPAQYRWSSHHAYLGAAVDPWVTVDVGLGMFGGERHKAIAAYRKFLDFAQEKPWSPCDEVRGDRVAALGSDEFVNRANMSGLGMPSKELLELIREACKRFDVTEVDIRSAGRNVYLMQVRAWIAHQSQLRRIATLSDAARALGRNEATLRYAIRKFPREVN